MIAVVSKKSFGLVLGVVGFPVLDKSFAKIDEGKLFFPGNETGDLGQRIEFFVHAILRIVALDPAGARALNDARPAPLELPDQLFQLCSELIRRDSGTGVVDPNLNYDQPRRGPNASTEGYSINGSQAKRVALNCAGTVSGGNRFSVSGPVRAGSWGAAGTSNAHNPVTIKPVKIRNPKSEI